MIFISGGFAFSMLGAFVVGLLIMALNQELTDSNFNLLAVIGLVCIVGSIIFFVGALLAYPQAVMNRCSTEMVLVETLKLAPLGEPLGSDYLLITGDSYAFNVDEEDGSQSYTTIKVNRAKVWQGAEYGSPRVEFYYKSNICAESSGSKWMDFVWKCHEGQLLFTARQAKIFVPTDTVVHEVDVNLPND